MNVLRFILPVALLLAPVVHGASAPAGGRSLKVVLVSGAETYNTDQSFADLASYLQREHGMACEVLRMRPDQKAILGIERLLQADTALFHVRRKTLEPDNLAVLKQF